MVPDGFYSSTLESYGALLHSKVWDKLKLDVNFKPYFFADWECALTVLYFIYKDKQPLASTQNSRTALCFSSPLQRPWRKVNVGCNTTPAILYYCWLFLRQDDRLKNSWDVCSHFKSTLRKMYDIFRADTKVLFFWVLFQKNLKGSALRPELEPVWITIYTPRWLSG